MTIQRYDFYYIDGSGDEREAPKFPNPEGEYVTYSDHLCAQDELIEALEKAADFYEDHGHTSTAGTIEDLIARHKGPHK